MRNCNFYVNISRGFERDVMKMYKFVYMCVIVAYVRIDSAEA